MTKLEALAKELRAQVGAPPESWQRAQRERVREALGEKRSNSAVFRFAPLLAASLAVVCALVWLPLRERGSGHGANAREAQALTAPMRLEDGSSIVLAPGGRGRLMTGSAAVHFELEGGRADFDVVPGQKRRWTITAGKNEVTVVGTRFSVTYNPSVAFEVEVERGAVSVRVPERGASVMLKAGDHLRGGPGRMEVTHGAEPAPARIVEERVPAALPQPVVSASPVAPPDSTARVQNDEWRDRYRDGKYAEALALLRAHAVSERLEELGPRMLAEVADVARLGGDLKLAARALSVLLRQYPGAGEARNAHFLLGRVHALSGDRASAVRAFESYLERGSSTQYANEAAGRLMELYSERGDAEQARAMARRYLSSAPNGPYRRLALSLTK
jgi:tetratricopeptide (TPR) repeat protein